MRLLTKLVGLVLLIVGVYFVGQNIIFTTQVSPFWWSDLSAAGSVLAITTGIISLLFFRRIVGDLGWGLVILGILLIFVSGRVVLLPTSLWYFFLSFVSLIAGFRLITTGRLDI
ncbi:hypothetical protein [Microseira sp. BLCC-F43]|jgi:hypothetical protein|uniref:hypothetical protein n=1 Tax=Microseira sp. BLCC-F43 TaxID=3153602 RepID=UPI0035B7603D